MKETSWSEVSSHDTSSCETSGSEMSGSDLSRSGMNEFEVFLTFFFTFVAHSSTFRAGKMLLSMVPLFLLLVLLSFVQFCRKN